MKRSLTIILIFLIPLALLYLYAHRLNNRPGQPSPMTEKDNAELRVASFNINHMSYNGDAYMTATALLRSVRDCNPDVVLLQEYKSRRELDEKAFITMMRNDYRYVSIHGECACLSKYPILKHARPRYEDLSDNFSDITLKWGSAGVVRIFAVHLRTTGINSEASKDYTLLKENTRIRSNQAHTIAARAKDVSEALIVAGDFNSIAGGSVYRKVLSAGLKDSFLESGHGHGSTYRNLGDFFRIDYMFYNDRLECTDSRIIDDGISDHRMIVSCFRLK